MSSSKQIAKQAFRDFSGKEGAHHMATEIALYGIARLIRARKVTSILEVGIGIGTIPHLISSMLKDDPSLPSILYYGTEDNDFCRQQLRANLTDLDPRMSFNEITLLSELPKDLRFDLVIIDGGDLSLRIIKDHVHERSCIFVEGDRRTQRQVLMEVFGNAVAVSHVVTNELNPSYSPMRPGERQGGYSVFKLDPTPQERWQAFFTNKMTALKERFRFLKF